MKKLIALILALVMCLSMVACAKPAEESAPATTEAEEPAESTAAANDTLTVAISTEPTSLDPYAAVLLYNDLVLSLVYSNLVRMDEGGNYVPEAAESWEPISDTEWQFTLHEGILFSDGTTMTSEDVKASIWATHDSGAVAGYAAWLKDVRVVDDRTFVIETTEPSERVLYDLSLYNYIVPKAALDSGANFNENPIGSGFYKLVKWDLGSQLVFEANTDYFIPEEAAKIPNLEWKIMSEGIARTIALQNGEVDFLYDVQATDLEQLEADEAINVYSGPYASPFYMAFNLQKEIFQDINVRKAIAAAINRDNASMIATGGYSQTIISPFVATLPGSTDEGAQGYDPELAKQLIEESGYSAEELTFTVITKEEPFKNALESIQSDLSQIGITLQIELMDASTYTARGADGDFDLLVGKMGYGDHLVYAFSSFCPGGAFNFNFLDDPTVNDLVNTGMATIDEAARMEIIDELIVYINTNVYRTGIYQLTSTRAYNTDLKNFETNPLSFDRFNMIEW